MTLPVVNSGGSKVAASPSVSLGWEHTLFFNGQQLVQAEIAGGDYIWRVEASAWNGATATLQYLGMDGATWFDVKSRDGASIAFSANGAERISIGQGATMRVALTGGVPTNLYSNLASL